jgi:HEAT repeat protein
MRQHVTVAPLLAHGEISGLVVTIEDVTARMDRERELAAALASDDPMERRRAEVQLALDEASAETLAGALDDARWRVRRAAAEQLAKGDATAAASLIAMLRERHRDPAALNAALAGLAATSEDVVTPLIALLSDDDADLRTYAALALGHAHDARAVPPLLAAIGDADANVRQHAIEALGRIGNAAAVPRLAEIAESRDFTLAFAALDALGAIGDQSVAPRLVPLLDDDFLSQAAADALSALGGAEVAAAIAALLDRDGADVVALAGALARLHARHEEREEGDLIVSIARATIPEHGRERLARALDETDERDLPGVVRVVSWLDSPDVETRLARLLERDALRHLVANALAARGARSVDALLDAMRSERVEVRMTAAAALGRVGSAHAVPRLVEALGDAPDVAIAAAGALGAIGDARAFEPLLHVLDHSDTALRYAAVAALDSIGHPDMPDRIRALLGHPSAQVRESAARVAGYFGYPACVDPMLALVRDDEEAVRRVVLEHLAFFDDPRAVHTLTERTANDERPSVRAAGARALAHVGAAQALEPLLRALRDPDPWVRYHAARSLAAQRLPASLAPLREAALGDVMPPVRIAAIEALAELRDDGLADVFDSLSHDADAEVALAARRAQLRESRPGDAARSA